MRACSSAASRSVWSVIGFSWVSSSVGGVAAVDNQHAAGHERRTVAAQKGDGLGDLDRCTDAAQRVQADQVSQTPLRAGTVGELALEQRSVDGSRTDDIDPDPTRR